jgi:IS30 family transposase
LAEGDEVGDAEAEEAREEAGDPDASGESDDEPETRPSRGAKPDGPGSEPPDPGPSEDEKRQIYKLHCNMGHPDNRKFVRVLRAGGAKQRLIRWVRREFTCSDCAERSRSGAHRKVALPRTFRFNHIVGVDLFYLEFQGTTCPYLNIVDHGSNLQVVSRVGSATAAAVWSEFLRSWVRPLGAPHLLISDGGSEFGARFARGLEQWGVCHHVCDADSPWQNGRVERHGGWVKERVRAELETGAALPASLQELDDLIFELVAHP